LDGKSNRVAWKFVRDKIPAEQLYRSLTSLEPPETADAIDDIGTDAPNRVDYSGVRYARDPKIRDAVKRRAGGKCEFCGELGFMCVDGTRYLECHHIIALAKDGADRMTNVIALCPKDHREAHFGARRVELENQMMAKVMIAQGAVTTLER
jgi:predicted restriction endonuclease